MRAINVSIDDSVASVGKRFTISYKMIIQINGLFKEVSTAIPLDCRAPLSSGGETPPSSAVDQFVLAYYIFSFIYLVFCE